MVEKITPLGKKVISWELREPKQYPAIDLDTPEP